MFPSSEITVNYWEVICSAGERERDPGGPKDRGGPGGELNTEEAQEAQEAQF